jgi:hypothetical protein
VWPCENRWRAITKAWIEAATMRQALRDGLIDPRRAPPWVIDQNIRELSALLKTIYGGGREHLPSVLYQRFGTPGVRGAGQDDECPARGGAGQCSVGARGYRRVTTV